jgi:hypothetical protein
MASFGRKTIFEGGSKADQGSSAPKPTAAMPGQITMSIFCPIIWLKTRQFGSMPETHKFAFETALILTFFPSVVSHNCLSLL